MKLILVSRMLNEIDDPSPLLRSNLGDGVVFVVSPTKANTYKLAEIKTFISKLSRKPSGDKECFYVLMQAHSLNPITQNALLKTVEESPYSIVLVSNDAESLLPTIKSRCQIKFLKEDKNHDLESISVSFSSLIKRDREYVVSELLSIIQNMSLIKYKNIIQIDEAIKKLKANCKIESILLELEWSLAKVRMDNPQNN